MDKEIEIVESAYGLKFMGKERDSYKFESTNYVGVLDETAIHQLTRYATHDSLIVQSGDTDEDIVMRANFVLRGMAEFMMGDLTKINFVI